MTREERHHRVLGNDVQDCLDRLLNRQLSPLDHLPHSDLREKLIELVLYGEPKSHDSEVSELFTALRQGLREQNVDEAKVVVFGGGSGLSNIIGGDCRRKNWETAPFSGIKELFPKTRSIVCVTDDGGSTGELLKDLPFIALGDIRHVLLSSTQRRKLQIEYGLTLEEAHNVAAILYRLFNYRFGSRPSSVGMLLDDCNVDLHELPEDPGKELGEYLNLIFKDDRLSPTLLRPNCLGNLIVAAAIYKELDPSLGNDKLLDHEQDVREAIYTGLTRISSLLGAEEHAVLPCTSAVSHLRVQYSNGVRVTGEHKSGYAKRGYPVDRVTVDFFGAPYVYPQVIKEIEEADILIMAPGSLYSSIIPIFQVPGLAEAVRRNDHALKILFSNLWVQAGETDQSISDPERKFYVSDMLRAYERNIPGGTRGLFNEVLCISLKDVPASVMQRYDIEGKLPIYLDRGRVKELGFSCIECGIFSQSALAERGVIQHDPSIIAQAVKTIYVASHLFNTIEMERSEGKGTIQLEGEQVSAGRMMLLPSQRYSRINDIVAALSISFMGENGYTDRVDEIKLLLADIIWKHVDILLDHLQFIGGLIFIDEDNWKRDQKWDNVFSFYDPEDRLIKIRNDLLDEPEKIEIAFLVALGESLLGDYAESKEIRPMESDGARLGKVYHLRVKKQQNRFCYFNDEELSNFLDLSRMMKNPQDNLHFTRLVNGDEGFTPPGLLMGMTYAWYLENRFASNIEYKMSIMRIKHSDLIPEQIKMLDRRQRIISFFREVVFS